MKRFKFLIAMFLLITLLIITIYMCINSINFKRTIYSDKNTANFNKKMNLIENFINENFEEQDLNTNTAIVLVSICNTETQAIVKSDSGLSLNSALKKIKNDFSSYIYQNDYNAEWIKIDIITNITDISINILNSMLSNLSNDYTFRNGIIFSNNNEEIILTESELNSNNIIDYNISKLNLSNLNMYLESNNKSKLDNLPNDLKLFSTISYFCDSNNKIYELYDESPNTGRRKQDNLQQNDLYSLILNGTIYLSDMVKDNGKYIYGYNPLADSEIDSYNILRHAGSSWSLIVCYDETMENSQKIKNNINNSLDYLCSQIQKKDNDLYYIVEEKDSEIKLGGNALSVIAMCEYMDKFQDNKYRDIAEKLGNGIISMQNESGKYIHVLYSNDYSTKDIYRTVYYDGEATFALCKLYGITKNEKYLDAAQKAMKYFIENDYTIYCDHWISYATNEITKYVDNENYYEFGLKNVANNIEDIYSKKYTSHTSFEMLIQCFELYNRALQSNTTINYLKQFSLTKLTDVIDNRAKFQLNSYSYPEISMYFKTPSKYNNTFFIRQNAFRIRIDDIQHSILGYYYYYKNFNDIYNT